MSATWCAKVDNANFCVRRAIAKFRDTATMCISICNLHKLHMLIQLNCVWLYKVTLLIRKTTCFSLSRC